MLELTIHNKGGPATWSSHVGGLHDEMGQCFYEVGRDPETKVVIITGTGDQFLTELDWSVPIPDIGTVPFWDRITREGKDLLMNLLEIDVPVIGAVNGPATIHAEIPTMSDIVLCSDNTVFADKAPYHDMVSRIPVRVITGKDTVLPGMGAIAAEPERYLLDYEARAWVTPR